MASQSDMDACSSESDACMVGDQAATGWWLSAIDSPDSGNYEFLTAFVRATMPQSLKRFLGASDIVQSVLMRVRRKGQQFLGGSEAEFRYWTLKIARHRIIDGLRRYRLAMRATQDLSGGGPPAAAVAPVSSCPDPADVAIHDEQVALLLASLQSLPADIHQIVIRRYAHEKTFEQIAQELGLSPATCRRRWREGCQLLRRQLGDLL